MNINDLYKNTSEYFSKSASVLTSILNSSKNIIDSKESVNEVGITIKEIKNIKRQISNTDGKLHKELQHEFEYLFGTIDDDPYPQTLNKSQSDNLNEAILKLEKMENTYRLRRAITIFTLLVIIITSAFLSKCDCNYLKQNNNQVVHKNDFNFRYHQILNVVSSRADR